jgi:enoyl-CoA hydratase
MAPATRYAEYEALSVSVEREIATVAMNRPAALNAVDARMHSELARIFVDLNADPEVSVVVLTGLGRAFSAGGDLDWMRHMIDVPSEFERSNREAKQIIFSLLDCEKPLIAKVNGPAIGLGATLALFCDIIFASQKARFADPHVAVGLVAGDGGTVIWPQLIGYAKAKEFLMTGDSISADEAERVGLINHSLPDEKLNETVDNFARRLASGACKAIRGTKISINIGLKQLASVMLDASLAYEAQSARSADHREAVTALREKRQPRFTGA